jgi:CheY-like chemotaxis protein
MAAGANVVIAGGVASMSARIMIIDDNPVIVELLERKLGRAGYEVLGCVESEQAVEQCTEKEPDLVILDILMPGISGWEVMKGLRENPETAAIPVIISTVKNRPEDVDKGKDLEAADYIAKPYVFGDLLSMVERIIGPAAAQGPSEPE